MADFAISYGRTFKKEVGYANNPADNGGETWNGISRVAHPRWEGWAVIDAAKKKPNFPKALENNTVLHDMERSLYKSVYWGYFQLDSCPNQMIADEIFDTAVNMGTGTAAKFLQQSLNACSVPGKDGKDLKVDGDFGGNSKHAFSAFFTKIQKDRHIVLYKMLNSLQGQRYITLADTKPSQRQFTFGWFTRVFEHF